MAYNLKEAARKPERFTGGHRMCAGCGAPVVARQILRALKPEDHAVIGSATGCMEVSTFIYPYTLLLPPYPPTASDYYINCYNYRNQQHSSNLNYTLYF